MALFASLTILILGFLIVKHQKFPVWYLGTMFYIEGDTPYAWVWLL